MNRTRAASAAAATSIRGIAALLCGLAFALLAGCASRPVNPRLDRADPETGYRPYLLIAKRQDNDPTTLFALTFSGGGTRAAALAYGVLEELRRVEIAVDGKPRRLLDEVDIISGVSGGSFTALAYALYGERLFSEYEQRFLKRDVEGELLARLVNPVYWPKFIGGSAGRSELAADYYDEILFEGATYADLLTRHDVPAAVAGGTDLSTGARFAFDQNDFDLLCSELAAVRLARAAATSSAVPVVLSPVTYDNYGGTCDYQFPEWVKAIENPETRVRPSGRAVRRYNEMREFQKSKERPYLHFVDGGVADNIGARGILEAIEELEFSAAYRREVGFGPIRRIVVLLVNAQSAPSTEWDRFASPPGFLWQLLQASSVPIDNYSYDTVDTMKDVAAIYSWRRQLLVQRLQLAGMSQAQAEASVPDVRFTVLDVSFEQIRDKEERHYFMNLPTTLALSPEQVDRLREIGGQLLRQSPDYRALVRELGGTPGD